MYGGFHQQSARTSEPLGSLRLILRLIPGEIPTLKGGQLCWTPLTRAGGLLFSRRGILVVSSDSDSHDLRLSAPCRQLEINGWKYREQLGSFRTLSYGTWKYLKDIRLALPKNDNLSSKIRARIISHRYPMNLGPLNCQTGRLVCT